MVIEVRVVLVDDGDGADEQIVGACRCGGMSVILDSRSSCLADSGTAIYELVEHARRCPAASSESDRLYERLMRERYPHRRDFNWTS